MNHKISEFLSKHEKNTLITYPEGVTYVERETIFDIFKRKPQPKIIKITFNNKKSKRR